VPRLFVAIDLPNDVKGTLSLLCAAAPLDARCTAADNLHLTLRFIGEVDGVLAQQIGAALRQVAAFCFSLTLSGLGHFGTRTLWIGVADNPALRALQGAIERVLGPLGLKPEGREYFPHVKLARLRSRRGLRRVLDENKAFSIGPFAVTEFNLVESRLTESGAVYRQREHYALAASREPYDAAAAQTAASRHCD
jgi:RNA 2',3'-cyclic 3'-phosphodiesterase